MPSNFNKWGPVTLRQMAVSAQRQADEKLKFRDKCLRRAEFLESKEITDADTPISQN